MGEDEVKRYKGNRVFRMVHPDGRRGKYDWRTGGVLDENGHLCTAVEAFEWNPEKRNRKDRPRTCVPMSHEAIERLREAVATSTRWGVAKQIGVVGEVVCRALAGGKIQKAKRLRIERWLGLLLAFLASCASSDPYANERTKRLVFSAPRSLMAATELAAEEWSAMTGLEIVVDSKDPEATPVGWKPREEMRWHENVKAHSLGENRLVRSRSQGFIGCQMHIGEGMSDDQVELTVLHEMGHCLAGVEGHPDTEGCLMSPQGQRVWCDSDVEYVCSQLDCSKGEIE